MIAFVGVTCSLSQEMNVNEEVNEVNWEAVTLHVTKIKTF